ncbi:uncharacterized protein si:ch211-195m9.3 [Mugil cephalus]|uniref:uncharacterized protein si:ch211-195m9.3 n=1 Tax=Mugil cephalus TaxID=48193 RepID=UPI001FB83C18|nr:uncharacterized protein si:ch211-195m9.3 [Mugil cephalus]
MLQTGSQMFPFLALGFACLMCCFTTGEAASGSNAAPGNICHRISYRGVSYDAHETVCCQDHIHHGRGLSCCGKLAYNPENATCCEDEITEGFSENVSKCCGNKPYNPLNEICCQTTITAKSSLMVQCCGEVMYDEQNQLCCGPENKKTLQTRKSTNHQCCGHDKQFDKNTECCCMTATAMVVSKGSTCCESRKQQKNDSFPVKREDQSPPTCTEPNTGVCGQNCYDPSKKHCCERHRTKPDLCSASDQGDPSPTVYDPHSQVCCDGQVHRWRSPLEQCCGDSLYSLAERGVLCCNNTLYRDREDGDECSDISIPYNPAKGTMCCSQLHASPGNHCCGTHFYNPHTEICCDGHSHHKEHNSYCCGVHAYNIKDPHMKCCAGTLYNLTVTTHMQCCGSVLHNTTNQVCCRSEGQEVLYSAMKKFECCGHHYYNTTLWSCCGGRLIPKTKHESPPTTHELRLLSVNNLVNYEKDHCNEIFIGTVESVSPESVVFNNVLRINGRNATVQALPLRIMEKRDHCRLPKLIRGKSYFFDKYTVFTNVNPGFIYQALHYIVSKCST